MRHLRMTAKRKAGYVRDDVTKVTLFDYSDIIADEKPVYPQKQTAEE